MRISASFLSKARRDAEGLMTDQCTVTRPGESTTDPDTGLPNTGTEQVYEGKCKVQTSGGLASEQTEGSAAQNMGAVSLVWSLYVHFHMALQAFAPVTWWKSRNPPIRCSSADVSGSSPRNRRKAIPPPAVGM